MGQDLPINHKVNQNQIKINANITFDTQWKTAPICLESDNLSARFYPSVSICRLLQDHSESTGVHSHALDTLKAKLEEAERKLKSSQETHERMQVQVFLKLCPVELVHE